MWTLPSAIPPDFGTGAVFLSVLVTQLGVPVPAAPVLILAGTMAAGGEASYGNLLLAAVVATLFADSLWFSAGRLRGRRLLNGLVRFSLSLDTTIRVARNVFERHGAPILAVAKFVPGLGLMSAPLLGTTSMDVRIFLLWDAIGATLWAGTWLIGGAALHTEIARFAMFVRANGWTIFDVLAAAGVLFLAYRWVRRLQLRHWLATHRISPDQLDEMMKSAAPPIVFDARPQAVREKEAYRIPGAQPLNLDSSEALPAELIARPIVVYCVCPNEVTAKRIVNRLRDKHIYHAHALRGGLDAWERRGYPVEPLSSEFHRAHGLTDEEFEGGFETDAGQEFTVRASLSK
ncbi:membrane protein DedA with SNARE-associated domain/rhodanese-related sulfurtransferase [Paraburkholderia bannensis]|uniref:Membrane protein DedA with SNARE-associated domain/rhodanese-related sulfurtransferase n=1 Tax=Paraburkholderia bannensis TaxID=765414 RepID=A0A7W9TY60_9BURK|nr:MULTISPECIES: VTT domain-containing protein [Paraburkholderia]MBB3258555.1 membrane protein DedA with SNARE-associated domain/rhodanese-related sulfurtransferase [Paraburkholderia sp. WP4_3_2]MBB6103568.1 membrane protein DedA with SNARE-associated domain/rhodanese-related sulfurtransferase [Paraburkholderia bannensis]